MRSGRCCGRMRAHELEQRHCTAPAGLPHVLLDPPGRIAISAGGRLPISVSTWSETSGRSDLAAAPRAADPGLGGRRAGAALLDPVELRCALLRTTDWAPTDLRIVVADLLEQEIVSHVPDLEAERLEAAAWIDERVEIVKEHAAHGRARAGADCNGCAFIAGCEAHA